jgi:hypothetical protein
MSTYDLPEGFPHDLTDDELDDSVAAVMEAVQFRFGKNVQSWLPELQLALVTMALSEQSRRQLADGSRIARISLLVGGMATVVAVIALFAS